MDDLTDVADRVRDVVRTLVDADRADFYADQIRIGSRLYPGPDSAAVQVGGQPVVMDSAWPVGPQGPLNFLASIDLQAMVGVENDLELPETGYLNFFYDVEAQPWGADLDERACWHVQYCPDLDGPTTAAPPGTTEFRSRLLTALPCVTIPNSEKSVLQAQGAQSTRDRFWSGDLLKGMPGLDWGRLDIRNQIGGWPTLLQDSLWYVCEAGFRGIEPFGPEATSLRRTPEFRDSLGEWQLLLQLDSDEEGTGWHWGLSGTIYFAIRRDDLANLRFDQVWLQLHST